MTTKEELHEELIALKVNDMVEALVHAFIDLERVVVLECQMPRCLLPTRMFTCDRRGKLTIDHINPRRNGGVHRSENLRIAHASCNLAWRKDDKDFGKGSQGSRTAAQLAWVTRRERYTPAQISATNRETARRSRAAQTPEQRREIALKSWETRRQSGEMPEQIQEIARRASRAAAESPNVGGWATRRQRQTPEQISVNARRARAGHKAKAGD